MIAFEKWLAEKGAALVDACVANIAGINSQDLWRSYILTVVIEAYYDGAKCELDKLEKRLAGR